MGMHTFTAVLHKEGDLYVADCPEVGTVSQGYTIEEAIANLGTDRTLPGRVPTARHRAALGDYL